MRMKRFFAFIVTLVAFQCGWAAEKARIVFNETEYVMTDSYLGETSEHVFVFKNVTNYFCISRTFSR